MNEPVKSIPHQNFMLDPERPHMEILETATGAVWQARYPVSAEQYEAFEPPTGFAKVGLGVAAMDTHWFRRSPDAGEDRPVRVRELGGREFAFCAALDAAPETPFGPDGPRRLRVDKHHTLLFRAGRPLDFLVEPDGRALVHVIAADAEAGPCPLPEGWRRETVELARNLQIDLPCPAVVWFLPNGDSFQGPVRLPEGQAAAGFRDE